MITLPGQLAIKTIHGRNGDFNVGRLATSIGEFTVKNAGLDQYNEGKYDGEFIITWIHAVPYNANGTVVTQVRADLAGITLSKIDRLSEDESHRLSPQESDPADEESQTPQPAAALPAAGAVAAPVAADPLIDTTPFGAGKPAEPASGAQAGQPDDAELFGTLWPLAQAFKLDATVNRLMLRKQCARLNALGYGFDPTTQHWQLKAA